MCLQGLPSQVLVPPLQVRPGQPHDPCRAGTTRAAPRPLQARPGPPHDPCRAGGEGRDTLRPLQARPGPLHDHFTVRSDKSPVSHHRHHPLSTIPATIFPARPTLVTILSTPPMIVVVLILQVFWQFVSWALFSPHRTRFRLSSENSTAHRWSVPGLRENQQLTTGAFQGIEELNSSPLERSRDSGISTAHSWSVPGLQELHSSTLACSRASGNSTAYRWSVPGLLGTSQLTAGAFPGFGELHSSPLERSKASR